jgi:hypothetical protein
MGGKIGKKTTGFRAGVSKVIRDITFDREKII